MSSIVCLHVELKIRFILLLYVYWHTLRSLGWICYHPGIYCCSGGIVTYNINDQTNIVTYNINDQTNIVTYNINDQTNISNNLIKSTKIPSIKKPTHATHPPQHHLFPLQYLLHGILTMDLYHFAN